MSHSPRPSEPQCQGTKTGSHYEIASRPLFHNLPSKLWNCLVPSFLWGFPHIAHNTPFRPIPAIILSDFRFPRDISHCLCFFLLFPFQSLGSWRKYTGGVIIMTVIPKEQKTCGKLYRTSFYPFISSKHFQHLEKHSLEISWIEMYSHNTRGTTNLKWQYY